MKKFLCLLLAILILGVSFINIPTTKASEATEFFSVSTDGFRCNGLITYTVFLKKDVPCSGASIRFKYDDSVLEVAECGPFMTEDSYGDPVENIPGIYESGNISGLSGVYGIIYMHSDENDYKSSSSDKPFVQITFRLKDDFLFPSSDTFINVSCYEFLSFTNPQLNIFKGNEDFILSETVYPKEHTFQNNVCSACGCLCFEYISNESGITITKYNGRKSSLEIPSSVDGLSVTKIGDGASPLCPNVINIKIADSIRSISENAFYGTSFYNNKENWEKGALYIENFLIDTNENLPDKYYVDNQTTVIADGVFADFSGYILCEENSVAHNYAIKNAIDFIIPTIIPVDNKTKIDFPNQLIFTSLLLCNNENDLISMPEGITTTPKMNGSYFGTGSTITAFNGDDYMGDYTIIAKGDLNGDGVCDVLDASAAERYSSLHNELSENEILAANGGIADEIDASEYQNVVNIALQ